MNKKKKILIVDDNKEIVRLLSLRLKANKFDVSAAYDGIQCVQIAKDELPDLILLDIKMPLGGGIRALETLKAMADTNEIPVIIITAFASKEVKRLVKEVGAIDLISKPFNSDELMKKVNNALDYNKIPINESMLIYTDYLNNILFDDFI